MAGWGMTNSPELDPWFKDGAEAREPGNKFNFLINKNYLSGRACRQPPLF
jgi:hypothetical protein